LVIGLTPDIGLRARRTRGCRACRARLGIRALDDRATGSGARRAFPNLTRLGTCRDTRRALGHRRLQHILGHVGKRRALRLQHVLAHIGHRGARRHRRLENPLGWIGLRAGRAARRILTPIRIASARMVSTLGTLVALTRPGRLTSTARSVVRKRINNFEGF